MRCRYKHRRTTVITVGNKIFYPIPHHHTAFIFFTNQKAQLWLLLVHWYILLLHLYHTPKCPYESQVEKWAEVKKHFFLDFVTWITFYSLPANIEWKLAHKRVMTWFSKLRKNPSCHITFPNIKSFAKKMTFYLSKIKFLNGLNPKTDNFGTFLRQTLPLQPNLK